MAQFEPFKDEIEAAGTLLYIAAQKRPGLFKPEKYLARHPVSFPFLLFVYVSSDQTDRPEVGLVLQSLKTARD